MTLLKTAAIGSIGFIGYMLLSSKRKGDVNEQDVFCGVPMYASVAGTSYNGRQECIANCFEGQPICLVREQSNPYNPNAIAVFAGEDQLGYIKQEAAEELAVMMMGGITLHASVEEITGGEEIPYGLIIKIEKEKELPDEDLS